MDGRIYSVATSPESVESVAKLGDVRMVMFADRPWEMRAGFKSRSRTSRKYHEGRSTPARILLFVRNQ